MQSQKSAPGLEERREDGSYRTQTRRLLSAPPGLLLSGAKIVASRRCPSIFTSRNISGGKFAIGSAHDERLPGPCPLLNVVLVLFDGRRSLVSVDQSRVADRVDL